MSLESMRAQVLLWYSMEVNLAALWSALTATCERYPL